MLRPLFEGVASLQPVPVTLYETVEVSGFPPVAVISSGVPTTAVYVSGIVSVVRLALKII